jgi:hypothetical protein
MYQLAIQIAIVAAVVVSRCDPAIIVSALCAFGATLIFSRDIEKILARQLARHALCKIANELGALMALVCREMLRVEFMRHNE